MRSILTVIATVLVVLISTHGGQVRAEDIDLFVGPPPTASTAKPNVLIVVDNSGSGNGNLDNPCGGTNNKIESEKCVISQFLANSTRVPEVNVGLEVFNPSGSKSGGYIRYHVRDMALGSNKTDLIAKVTSIPSANNAPFAKAMHEAYMYYNSNTPFAGVDSAQYDSAAYDAGANKYNGPITDKCQRNYIIFIGNGGPDSSKSGGDPELMLGALGGKRPTDPIKLNPNDYESDWADEYARFMYGSDASTLAGNQNIITYSIAINTTKYDANPSGPETTKSARAGRELIKSMATQGKGEYFEVANSNELNAAFDDIFRKIQAVNSVFAAVTLPVSVNVRGTYLNQVYMGVFRPDADANPLWVGNLKEYQLTLNNAGDLQLSDRKGNLVTNSSTGFVNPGVESYWTENSSFWTFKGTDFGVGGQSDNPDGDLVEKGAAAQWLRTEYATSQATRRLYTCTGTCTTNSLLSASPFSTVNTNITAANTGTANDIEKDQLIDWVRGQDNKYNENNNAVPVTLTPILTDARASIHGDVLHSRPAVINYNRNGPTDSNDVFVFYGSNDGIFHAIQGGQLTSGTRKGGIEKWGFIPSEFFGRLKRLRENNVDIMTAGKPYFVDGPIGVHLDAGSDNKLISGDEQDTAQLFLGMRRGGDLVYALDVTDPETPKFMWKKYGESIGAGTASTGYGELAQTWSTPKPVKIRASAAPVLIMGAGYDAANEDTIPQGSIKKGRGVLVVNATNGDVLWQVGFAPTGATTNVTEAGMNFSMAADMMILDRNFDTYMDRVYAVDTGANVWRLDIDSANVSDWKVTKIAALGGSGTDARKFLFAPDVVYGDSPIGSQPYDAIMIGSGDREHPFDTKIVNRFYMLKDTNMEQSINPGWTEITEADLFNTTDNKIQDGTPTEQQDARDALNKARGWYITLAEGEKVVGGSVTLNGSVFFGTNQPSKVSDGACNNLGTARLYSLSFTDGASTLEQCSANGGDTLGICDRSTTLEGGGYPPSPTPVVTIIDGQPREGVVTGTHVQEPPASELGLRRRIYWHQNIDK